MSNSVDNRVVSMEFDNAKFERNVAQSLETLKHLDQSLDGLINSSKKFDGVSFEDVANSIDSIANRFTLMGRVAQAVFDDIAQGIVNLGHKLMNFSLEGVTSGWDKYAEKTTSVQTIMSATGQEIDYVEEQLDRLNRFTDETSYNFSDMTSNIAKFTSQGIDLDTAVTQMQGIATWAASAGQNAQAASRAMYNISQAMGAGSMKLIDWKSIQNANMATKEFKEQAIAAGLAAKTLVEQEGKIVVAGSDIEVTTKNFEQTLQKGWFNTGAMQKVFSDYGKFADTVDDVFESFNEKFTVSELMAWSEQLANVGESSEDAAKLQEELEDAVDGTGYSVEQLKSELEKLNDEELAFSRATYKAAQEAKTLGDAIDATKDAVSTSWMNLFQSLFGNYEEQRHLWTDMANWWYDIFAEPINGITTVTSKVMENSRVIKKANGTIQDLLSSSGSGIDKNGNLMVSVLKKSGLLTDEMIKDAGSVEAAIANVTGSTDSLKTAINDMLASNGSIAKSTGEYLEEYREVAKSILKGDFGNGAERRDALIAAGLDPTTAQLFAEYMHLGLAATEDDLWRIAEASSNLSDEQREALTSLLKTIEETDGSIEELYKTFDFFDDKYANWTGRELLFGRENDRRGAIYDLMDIINTIGDSISGAWKEIFDFDGAGFFRNLLENFKRLTQGIKDAIGNGEKLKSVFKGVFSVLDVSKMAFSAVFKGLKSIISLFLPTKLGIGDVAASFGNWLTSIHDWIKENKVFEVAMDRVVSVFKTLRESMQPVIDKIQELWKSFKESDGVQKVLDFFADAFQSAIYVAQSAVASITDVFTQLFTSITNFYNKYLSKYITPIVTFVQNLANGTISVQDVFNNAKNAVVDFFTILINFFKTGDYETFLASFKERFEDLYNWIVDTKTVIEDWFGQFDKETVNTVLKLVTALISLVAVLKILKSFKSIKTSITGFLDSLSSSIKSFVRNYKVNTVLKIAASIGILVGALYVLAKMPAEEMKQGMQALLAIMTMFLSMMIVAAFIGKMADPATMAGLAGTMAAIVGGLIAAALSMWILTTKVDYSKIWSALGTLFAVLTFLTASVIAISRFAGPAAVSITGVVALAAGILLTVYALERIQKSSGTITSEAFKKLFAIIGILVAASFAIRGVSLSGALGLLVFVLSLSTITKALVKFMDEIPEKEAFEKHMDDFLEIIKMLTLLAVPLRVAGKGRLSSALSLIAVLGALYLLAKAAADLGTLPAKQLEEGTKVVTAIGEMLTGLIYAVGVGSALAQNGKAFSTAVIAVVIALIAIGIELIILSNQGWDKLKPAIVAIGSVMVGLALVLSQVANLAKGFDKNSLLSLIIIVGMLAGVFAAVWALSKFGNADAVIQSAISLGITMLALAGAMKIISSIDYSGANLKQIGLMVLEMVGFLGTTTLALFALSKINIGNGNEYIIKVGSLIAVLLALAGSMKIIGNIDFASYDWKGLGIMVLEMVAFLGLSFAALAALNALQVDTSTILPKVLGLSIIMLATAAALRIVNDSSGLMATATDSARAFVLAIGGLIALIAIVGGLDELFGFGTALKNGASILGEAIGAFIGGIAEGVTESAIAVADNLSEFINHLKPFLDGLTNVDESKMTAMSSLGSLLVQLAKAEIGNSIANIINNWAGADDGSLTTRLTGFANAVTAYVNATKGLEQGDVTKATMITNAVAKLLDAVPKEGGKLDWLFGSKSDGMKNLSDNLSGFAEAIVAFGKEAAKVDDSIVEDIKRVSNAMTPLSELTDGIQRTGGLWQKIIGEADIAAFGSKLVAFVRMLTGDMHSNGLFAYLPLITDDKIEDIKKLGRATDALVEATKNIPELGGLVDKLFGSDSPSDFGSQMVDFCKKVIEVADTAADITEERITDIGKATEAAYALNAFSNAFYGTHLPENAAEGMPQVAQDVTDAANTLADGDFDTAAENAKQAAAMTTDLKGIQGFVGFDLSSILPGGDGASFDLSSLINVESLSTALTNLQADASTGIQGLITAFTTAAPTLQTTAGTFIDSAKTGITDKNEELIKTGEDAAAKVLEGFKNKNEEATTAGGEFIASFASGITTKISETDLFSGLSTALSTNLSENAVNVQAVGASMVASFIGGLESKRTDAYNAGSIPVDEALRGISEKGKLYEDEPESMKLGKFFGDGFIKGTETKLNKAHEMGVKIANELLAGIKSKEADATTKGADVGESFLTALDLYLQTNQEAIQGSGTSFVGYVNTGIEAGGKTMTAAGLALTTSAGKGITSGEEAVTSAATDVAASGATSLEQGASGAIAAGEMFALGFAQGIMNKAGEIASAAAEVARSALAAVQGEIDSHSPSRETMKFGSYFGEGFAIGIRDTVSLVESDAVGLASAALDAVSTAAQLASDIVESDVNPVITPVLDLSEVHRQAAGISNLGGFAASVSASRAGMVSDAVMARQIQNGTPIPQTAVLSDSAIKALMSKQQAPGPITIEFTGDLAQLARVLHPVILDQYNYHGDSLIK